MEAGVAFHWLRRERVRERDIFRLGNGTVVLLYFCLIAGDWYCQRARKYPPALQGLPN